LIVLGGQMLDAYDPRTGKQLWFLPDLIGNRTITGPVAAGGMIYAVQGQRNPLLAVRPGGDGRRPREDVAWQYDSATPDAPTPTVWNGLLVMVANNGTAQCLDAQTGKLYWKEKLKGEYRASPLAADGRIYFVNTRGLTTVVAAAKDFQKLAENPLDDETFASPIAGGGKIFVRGKKSLYCLGK
jgi:outer membrane protein assembly factor BamB